MAQTSYTNDLTIALAGMLADDGAYDILSYPAGEEIPPGRQCVLNSEGKLELPQDTTFTKPVGVSCYLSASGPPSVFPVGAMVPCVRKGRVWAETTGSAPGELVDVNVNHSSTTSTHRGKFTTTAQSGSAGSEISDPGAAVAIKAGPSGLALIEVNYPGAGNELTAIYKKTVTVPYDHASFVAESDDGDAVDINVGTALPAGAVLLAARYTITTPFAGAGVASLTMIVGFSGDTNGVIEAVDIFGDAAAEYRGTPGTAMGGPAGSKQLVANFDPDASAALDELTAGSVTIDVFYTIQA